MVLFGEKPDINTGVQEYNNSDNAVLLDVREADEFAGGHIPGAVNLPLSQISQIDIPRDKSLYVYHERRIPRPSGAWVKQTCHGRT